MAWAGIWTNAAGVHYHSGSWQGFKARLSRFTGADLDIIVLANLAQADLARFVDCIATILNPSLAVSTPMPIEDKEPQVTQRLTRLLETIREGKLAPADFAYVRAGFFPNSANSYRDQLKKLGVPTKAQLLERFERGDDRIYLYELTFAIGSRFLQIGLAPDDRVSSFSIRSEP